MTEIAKRIRAITTRVGQTFRAAGFKRHGTSFSRQFGESLRVVSFQSSKWNTSEVGRFTINVGVHFPKIAALVYGKDPMPQRPSEAWCLLRTRVGMLMPNRADHWWTVTPSANIDEPAKDILAVCSDRVLPWLEQFSTVAGVNWRSLEVPFQHACPEAAGHSEAAVGVAANAGAMKEIVFSKEGIRALHREAHGCLDIVFRHAATLPFSSVAQELAGASHGSVRNQMVHVLYTEAGWVGDLQNKPVATWRNEDFRDVESLVEAKRRVASETAKYLDSLSEAELNRDLAVKPKEWVGPLRSPAFILHHIVTHAFHHKGQMAMMFRMLGHPIGDTDLQRSPE